MAEHKYIVTTFYKFVIIKDCDDVKLKLLRFCKNHKIKGTLLIASEGINATITGSREAIDAFYPFLQSFAEFKNTKWKESLVEYAPFRKLKVKIKPEIVTFREDLDMTNVGEYLAPKEWDALLSNKQAVVIDCRNDYETVFGTFKNSVDPNTRNFTDLKDWVAKNLSDASKDQPVGMFCTGGVRCEKSTAYMKKLGFKNVYHLEGGILKYLEDTKNESDMWIGECFVFDDRIAVDEKLDAYAIGS